MQVYRVEGEWPMLVIAENEADALAVEKAALEVEYEEPPKVQVIPEDETLELGSVEFDPEYDTYAHVGDEGELWSETKTASEWVQELGRGTLALDGYSCCGGYIGGLYRFLWKGSRKEADPANFNQWEEWLRGLEPVSVQLVGRCHREIQNYYEETGRRPDHGSSEEFRQWNSWLQNHGSSLADQCEQSISDYYRATGPRP